MSVKLMGAVWDSDLPRDEKTVLLSYADHAAHDGTNVYPSVGLTAWKTGYSERSVQVITGKLIERGVLIPVGKSKLQTNAYVIDASKLPQREKYRGGAVSAPIGAENVPEGVQKTTQGGAEIAPKPSCNHHEETSAANAAEPPLKPPPKRSPKKQKTPPAVNVFRENAHRYPAKAWYGDIAAIVGEGAANLARWGVVVKAYVGCGWNPMNVSGMLDFFQRGEIPKPGKRAPPDAPRTPEERRKRYGSQPGVIT